MMVMVILILMMKTMITTSMMTWRVNNVDNEDYLYIADSYCDDNSDVRCILMLMMMTMMITFIYC